MQMTTGTPSAASARPSAAGPAPGGPSINITELVDAGPISRYQVMAIVLCSLVAFLDGLDSQSIAVAAPIMADNLKLARSALGPIFSAGLFGAMLGALTFGPLADRFGRKAMLIVSAVIFGAFTLLTAYAYSYETLLGVRFLAGIGLGGATPCFLALASEYAPRRRRAMVTSLLWAAFPLGGALGSFINAYILAHSSWQTMFGIGGALPFIVAIALVIWLPESIRFLMASGRHTERLGAILRRMRPDLPVNASFTADEERIEGVPFKHLFTEGRAVTTLLLWVPFFTAFAVLAIAVVWAPVLLRDHGIPPAQAAVVIGVSSLGALIGMSGAGRLMERFGSVGVLVPALILGGLATAALGHSASAVGSMAVVMFLIGLLVGIGSSGSIALAALTYPTAIRSSGIGWAMGMGRFGQVLAPLFASAMVASGMSGTQLFHLYAIAPIVGAIAIVALRRVSSLNARSQARVRAAEA